MSQTHLSAIDIEKSYYKGSLRIPVLKGVSFQVERGEFVSIVGTSGSGKSTLLHLLGTLDQVDAGALLLEGKRIDMLSPSEQDRLRNRVFGFIFQFYHLLPELNTLENILLPSMIRNPIWRFLRMHQQERAKACQILEQVGLGHRLTHKPSELSGGEMQRAAIARAIVSEPDILLADEPTGNLDSENGQEILQLLRRLNTENNLTVIMVTHDLSIAQQADRIVRLEEGMIQTISASSSSVPPSRRQVQYEGVPL